ncbi:ATP-binding cassette domain-containing protein [Mesorhizobium sp. B2-4-16]|nr:ATP-binding cassette domain-containing protein [Mesorhizobium sp. B2-4-16]
MVAVRHRGFDTMTHSALPLLIDDIYFGERDGLHEYMKQERLEANILDNSFVNPPKVKLQELYTGARYIIAGPKGAGKTTLLWHLKRSAPNHQSKVILFKSQIRKEDRDRLDKMIDMVIVEDQRKFKVEADYKTIWEWYILKNVVRLMSPESILSGHDIYKDIAIILEADKRKFNTLYEKMYLNSAKGQVKISFDIGMLKTELGAEIEARREQGDKISLLDLVRLVQDALPSIKLKVDYPVRLYFDELEFFMSEDGDGERDRRMVRDLLFASYTTNTICTACGLDVVVYASVRTELLNSIGGSTQEINKIVNAFGVVLNWYHEDVETHPVLTIFSNKIQNSEIMKVGRYSEDVWKTYFPMSVRGKGIKRYLLDIGLHRPRGVLLRIISAVGTAGERDRFTENDFLDTEETYGAYMLEEFVDEIAATYDEPATELIISLFRGNHYAFTRADFDGRLRKTSATNKAAKAILERSGTDNLLKLLFRIGMIGNHFDIEEAGVPKNRQVWAVRGATEPLLEKRFVLHQSVRKVLATV